MLKTPTLLLAIIFGIGSIAFAEVTVSLPQYTKIVAVNGQNASVVHQLHLPEGLNQIALLFEGPLRRTKDSEQESSEVVIATFSTKTTQLNLRLPTITTERQLDLFNRNPQIDLIDNNGKHIAVKTALLKKDGFQVFRDYQQELFLFNQSGSPAAVSELTRPNYQTRSLQTTVKPTSGSKEKNSPAVRTTSATVSSKMAEDMLKYWYQQADEKTRERFKKWIFK